MSKEGIERKLGELILQQKYSNILLVALVLVIALTNTNYSNIDFVILGVIIIGLLTVAAITYVTTGEIFKFSNEDDENII